MNSLKKYQSNTTLSVKLYRCSQTVESKLLPGFTRAQPPVNNSMRFRQMTDSGLLKPARYTILKITLEYGKLRSTMKLLAGRVVCLWKDISNDGLLVVVAIC